MRMAWMMETSRRVAVLVGEPRKRVKDEDVCLHAAEEMFSLHAPIGNARYFIISDVSGDSCRKISEERVAVAPQATRRARKMM